MGLKEILLNGLKFGIWPLLRLILHVKEDVIFVEYGQEGLSRWTLPVQFPDYDSESLSHDQ